jgi:hypothetical protein
MTHPADLGTPECLDDGRFTLDRDQLAPGEERALALT